MGHHEKAVPAPERNPILDGQNNHRMVLRSKEMFLTKVKLSSFHPLSKLINLDTETMVATSGIISHSTFHWCTWCLLLGYVR